MSPTIIEMVSWSPTVTKEKNLTMSPMEEWVLRKILVLQSNPIRFKAVSLETSLALGISTLNNLELSGLRSLKRKTRPIW